MGRNEYSFLTEEGLDLPLPRHLGRSHEGAGLYRGAAGEREQAEEGDGSK